MCFFTLMIAFVLEVTDGEWCLDVEGSISEKGWSILSTYCFHEMLQFNLKITFKIAWNRLAYGNIDDIPWRRCSTWYVIPTLAVSRLEIQARIKRSGVPQNLINYAALYSDNAHCVETTSPTELMPGASCAVVMIKRP